MYIKIVLGSLTINFCYNNEIHSLLTFASNVKNMYCWGRTIHGELGLGGIEDENILIPRKLDFQKASEVKQSITFFIKLICFFFHCMFISKVMKSSFCYFGCYYFQIMISIYIIVACGENHTVIIIENGQIYSCGNNDSGQLGHEKPTKRLRNKGY
jgi:E3 ubiquitin-protein ligase HERC4